MTRLSRRKPSGGEVGVASRKGGQSALRFARLAEERRNVWVQQIAEEALRHFKAGGPSAACVGRWLAVSCASASPPRGYCHSSHSQCLSRLILSQPSRKCDWRARQR